jgi:lipopolysaccharide assembly protein A
VLPLNNKTVFETGRASPEAEETMQLFLIVSLFIAVIAVVFALQNASMVMINFLSWRFEGSLALLLLVTFCMGVIVSVLAAIPSALRKHRQAAERDRKIRELETTLTEYKKAMTPVQSLQ